MSATGGGFQNLVYKQCDQVLALVARRVLIQGIRREL
jgi:hypothetical protein